MQLYDIITVPHPSLKAKAQPVEQVTEEIRSQIDRMFATMYEAPGIGLAANQVDILNRVFVVDLADREGGEKAEPLAIINPEILWHSEEKSVMNEGCLSIPGQLIEIERPAKVRMKYLDYAGKVQEIEGEGLLAHCLQHEYDHLEGRLIIDGLSSLKRNMLIKKIKKMQG